jgi:ABC-type phosphate/phosphonate transport system permease subunit
MGEDRSRNDAVREGTNGGRAETTVSPPPTRRWKWKLLGLFLLLLPLLVFAAWTAIMLHWPAYSSGNRAGYIQKFSHKGWVCKTWEGEIAMVNMPGAAQERFSFSVRDDSVAREITRLMGSRVSLTYEQRRGIPTRCFGETEYFVTAVKPVP